MIGPKGRDLEHVAAVADGHRPEGVLVDGARKQRHDLIGERARGEVPIRGGPVEEDIAKRSSDGIRGVPGAGQCGQDAANGMRDSSRDPLRSFDALARQFRPRKRYVRHASFRSSVRYGVKSE